ncbi:PLP-dependent aminotransferase family protein [Nonomuraea sp. NPDC047897]|uniref:aminotransferase-like domain-containing protein n=1 Tax=Nonomuraea sp. NPDC047897 TaxID=3364346 RepID=UPI003722FC89
MRSLVDLPVSLDRGAALPLSAQLADWLRRAMLAGTLAPGERLPSSRGLAAQLGVSRTVITEAFQQLYAEGWLEGRHGSGTFVAPAETPRRPVPPEPGGGTTAGGSHAATANGLPGSPGAATASGLPGPPCTATANGVPSRPRAAPASGASGARSVGGAAGARPGVRQVDLRPGHPWVRDYDEPAWRRAWRRAADLPPGGDPDPYGLPHLRELLADHLRRTRAVTVGPENILVTRGTGNGLDLCALALLAGGGRAGVEEPGYRVARAVFAARGAEIVPCPVDEDGVVVDGLPGDLGLLYTTPAHQYPLGGRLPIPRRERLLGWARATGATVVEDDYDAEFRYDVAPLPALFGLDPSRVVLLGTLSKTLAPDVGLGWLVGTEELVHRVAALRDGLGDRTSGPVQQAVATLLERGDLDRHLRRMRLEYARRRAVVVEVLGGVCRLRGDTAGLHVLAELPADAVAPLVAAAREEGVLLDTTARHHHGPPRVHGLVIGYGSASLPEVRRGCAILARLVARLVAPRTRAAF